MPNNINDLFVRAPGDAIYFFAIILIILASFSLIVGLRSKRAQDQLVRRYTIAFSGLILVWLTLFAGTLYALVADEELRRILPPLESFAGLTTIVLMIWALNASGRRSSRAGILVGVGLGASIGACVYTLIEWMSQYNDMDYMLSTFAVNWIFATALLSGVGALLILASVRSVVDAPLKTVFLVIVGAGHAVALLQIADGGIIGDAAGIVRLSLVIAFLLIPVIAHRLILGHYQSDVEQLETAIQQMTPVVEAARSMRESDREAVQLLRVLGMILEDATATALPERVVRAVINVFQVDVVALLNLQDANYADVTVAIDHLKQRSISGIAINLDQQPSLVNAIQRRDQQSILPGENDGELGDIYTRLDIDEIGPIYIQPLSRERELVSILMVAFPYSKRELQPGERDLLKGVAVIAGNLLALGYAADEARKLAEERAIYAMATGISPDKVADDDVVAARHAMQQSLKEARDEIGQLNNQITGLKLELEEERGRVALQLGDTEEGQSISQQMLALNLEHQRLREERDTLLAELNEAEAVLRSLLGDEGELEEVDALRREQSELARQRDDLQSQLDVLRTPDAMISSDSVQAQLERMETDRIRLERERDALNQNLIDVQARLQALGYEGGAGGLTQLLHQLIGQRSELTALNTALQRERDALLEEREKIAGRIQQGGERETQIRILQMEVENLAGDREAALKQRDKLQAKFEELLAKVDLIKGHRARLLAQASGYEIELQEAHEEQASLRNEIQRLANERSDLIHERDRLLAEKRALETDRDQLLARIEGDRNRIQELGNNGVGSLTAMIEQLTADRSALEHQLYEVRKSLADVENKYEALKMRIGDNEKTSEAALVSEDFDMLLRLVHELRVPMGSMVGYVDLLLDESAGILGEMQRKFLQRISSNMTRMTTMLDDLIRIAQLDTGKFELEPVPVDVTALVEDSITSLSNQFREKGLTIDLNLDDAPSIHVDRDAVSQIVGQLLTNAYLASPPESEIFIGVQQRKIRLDAEKPSQDCIVVSVGDRGGGIRPEDEARVFMRKVKAENPLIHGLGDTGVGMAIARALVEAHGGRLWLESKANVGSMFRFALPMAMSVETEG